MFSYSKWNSKMIITFFRTFTTWGYLYSQFLQRLWFLGFCLFSKKTWVLAARLGARNFTRALGYAKHPLSVVHAFADARFHRRTLSQTHAFADARFCRRTLSQMHAFADTRFRRRGTTLLHSYANSQHLGSLYLRVGCTIRPWWYFGKVSWTKSYEHFWVFLSIWNYY